VGRRTDRKAREALDKSLTGMIRRLEDRPVPDRIRSVVEQLDETTPTEGRQKIG
jgi:hypothetical protein